MQKIDALAKLAKHKGNCATRVRKNVQIVTAEL